jgi:fumarate hydratase class II
MTGTAGLGCFVVLGGETSGTLKTVAVSLSNSANNIRWLGSDPRCGIGEIRIPPLQPDSSIMPSQVNPVISEAVMMVAAQVVGNDATIAWAGALGSNFDLNMMMPIIAYNLLQSIELRVSTADHLTGKCVDAAFYLAEQNVDGPVRIEADEERCQELVEKSLALGTALAPRIGYDNAAAIAEAYHEGRTIREIALELVGMDADRVVQGLGPPASATELQHFGEFPSRDETDRLLDPRKQTERGAGATGGASG